jgi:hypothetical protein
MVQRHISLSAACMNAAFWSRWSLVIGCLLLIAPNSLFLAMAGRISSEKDALFFCRRGIARHIEVLPWCRSMPWTGSLRVMITGKAIPMRFSLLSTKRSTYLFDK